MGPSYRRQQSPLLCQLTVQLCHSLTRLADIKYRFCPMPRGGREGCTAIRGRQKVSQSFREVIGRFRGKVLVPERWSM